MSFFNKGFRAFSSAPTLFNKISGGARGIFSKAPMVARQISGGLGQASRALGSAAARGDQLLSDPAVAGLARQLGAGGLLGGARGITGTAGSASALLGRASQATDPSTYAGQSPAAAVSSAIERAKSLGGQAKNIFM
jgi:hypothetical protein